MKNVNENNAEIKTESAEYTPNAKPFAFGRLVMTRGVADMMQEQGIFDGALLPLLLRHAVGDWGDMCTEDKIENDKATHNGKRVISAYMFCGQKIWIITEWDRSVTTVLFPSEY